MEGPPNQLQRVSAATADRRPSTYRPRDFPRVFELLTRVQLDKKAQRARDQANPYKRQALRLAFMAGWNTAPHMDTVMSVLKSDLMSSLGKSAFYAGVESRLLHDNPPPKEKHRGRTTKRPGR